MFKGGTRQIRNKRLTCTDALMPWAEDPQEWLGKQSTGY